MNHDERFNEYIKVISNPPYKRLTQVEFLNNDGNVAFTLGSSSNSGYGIRYNGNALIQSGSLSASRQNGQRRKASLTISNIDNEFEYNVNNIWFGAQIRISLGVVLPDGSAYYIPQGVFYIKDPSAAFNPKERTVTYPLVDKWAYLDGTLMGNLAETYQVDITRKRTLPIGFRELQTLKRKGNGTMRITFDESDTWNALADGFDIVVRQDSANALFLSMQFASSVYTNSCSMRFDGRYLRASIGRDTGIQDYSVYDKTQRGEYYTIRYYHGNYYLVDDSGQEEYLFGGFVGAINEAIGVTLFSSVGVGTTYDTHAIKRLTLYHNGDTSGDTWQPVKYHEYVPCYIVSHGLPGLYDIIDGKFSPVSGSADTFDISNYVSYGNIYDVIRDAIRLSKYTYGKTNIPNERIDNQMTVFTDYYANKSYKVEDGTEVEMTDIPYTMQIDTNIADIVLECNSIIAGWIGYDRNGCLTIEPSQDDINDSKKNIIWEFTPENSTFLGLSETTKNSEVYNDVLVVGQGASGYDIWGRASNYDARSETNINLIGRRTLVISGANFFTAQQCVDWAVLELKKRTVLQKSVTISCLPILHISENTLVTVKRTDKAGSPVEKHIVTSYTLPLSEKGNMTINCTSVNDFPDLATTRSSSETGQE